MATADRPRFVLGSVGPGTKLPTLGHESYARLRDAYAECGRGLIAGGSDALVVETCQDLLQVKAAVLGLKAAMRAEGRRVPIITHVTVETTGTMLLGSEIGAALTAIEPLGVDLIGLNCATGPGRDERAPAHPGQARAHPAVGDAERRPAPAGPARRGVPARPGRAGRGTQRVRPRLRAAAGRRLLRDDPGARPGRRRRHPRRHPRAAPPASGAGRELALRPGAVPPGHLGADGGRAHQRQRLQGLPRGDARAALGRLRRDGPRADPRRRAPDRPQRRLRGPRRRRGHGGAGRPAGHRVHAADHARLDRAGGAARRAGAPGRPVDRQLGELRRRRRPRVALPADDGAGPRARCGRRRAVHRRGGPGPHRRVEGPDRGPAHPRPDHEPRHARRGHRRRHPHLPDHHRAGGGPPRRAGDDRGDPRAQAPALRACRPRWASRTCRSGSTPPPGRC